MDWEASSDPLQTQINQILSRIFLDVDPSGYTGETIDDAAKSLGFSDDIGTSAYRAMNTVSGILHRGDRGLVPTSASIRLDADGIRLAALFRLAADHASSKHKRAKYARRAILRWVDIAQTRRSSVDSFLEHPTSYFYGNQLTQTEIRDAAKNLVSRGLLSVRRVGNGALLRPEITVKGTEIMEDYDGDPDGPDARSAPTFSIGKFVQSGGNSNIGGRVESQHSTTVVLTQQATAADLAAAIRIALDLDYVPRSDIADLQVIEGELVEAATAHPDETKVTGILAKAGTKIRELANRGGNAVGEAFFTALGTYLAVRAGIG